MKVETKIEMKIKTKNRKIQYIFVRLKLCTRCPGVVSNESNAPATHSQQSKIGVPPILELNNTSFGNRRTIALAYCHIR